LPTLLSSNANKREVSTALFTLEISPLSNVSPDWDEQRMTFEAMQSELGGSERARSLEKNLPSWRKSRRPFTPKITYTHSHVLNPA